VNPDLRDVASKVVAEIVKDLTDRRGLRQQWEKIDEDVQNEIVSRWKHLVFSTLLSES
jgi:hypothetical protein